MSTEIGNTNTSINGIQYKANLLDIYPNTGFKYRILGYDAFRKKKVIRLAGMNIDCDNTSYYRYSTPIIDTYNKGYVLFNYYYESSYSCYCGFEAYYLDSEKMTLNNLSSSRLLSIGTSVQARLAVSGVIGHKYVFSYFNGTNYLLVLHDIDSGSTTTLYTYSNFSSSSLPSAYSYRLCSPFSIDPSLTTVTLPVVADSYDSSYSYVAVAKINLSSKTMTMLNSNTGCKMSSSVFSFNTTLSGDTVLVSSSTSNSTLTLTFTIYTHDGTTKTLTHSDSTYNNTWEFCGCTEGYVYYIMSSNITSSIVRKVLKISTTNWSITTSIYTSVAYYYPVYLPYTDDILEYMVNYRMYLSSDTNTITMTSLYGTTTYTYYRTVADKDIDGLYMPLPCFMRCDSELDTSISVGLSGDIIDAYIIKSS